VLAQSPPMQLEAVQHQLAGVRWPWGWGPAHAVALGVGPRPGSPPSTKPSTNEQTPPTTTGSVRGARLQAAGRVGGAVQEQRVAACAHTDQRMQRGRGGRVCDGWEAGRVSPPALR